MSPRLLLLAWVLLPCIAWADFKAAYRDGVAAAERKDWARVQTLMRQALAEEPNPNPRVRLYGMRFEAYIPHYYLGLAAFELKDCRGALENFQNSRHQAAVSGLREAERQGEMVRTCQSRQLADTRPAEPPPTAPPATSPPAPPAAPPVAPPPPATSPMPSTPAVATTPPRPEPVAAPPPPPALDAQRLQATGNILTQAENSLSAAQRQLADPVLAQERANRQRSLDALAQELRQLRSQFDQARSSRSAAALTSVESALATLTPRLQSLQRDIAAAQDRSRAASLAAARDRLDAVQRNAASLRQSGADGAALGAALSQAQEAMSGNDPARMLAAADNLERAATAARTAMERANLARELRAILLPLVQAHLNGDHATLLGWRGDRALEQLPEAQAQALLLRAAARYESYVLGGERDLALAEAAREDVRAARAAQQSLTPPAKAFSPRFRAFYSQTR